MMQRSFAAGLSPLVVLSLAVLATPPASAEQKPQASSFVETFDRLDRKLWYISDGWANGDHQNCTWSKNQVSLKDGILKLGFSDRRSKDRAHSCAEIQTNPRYLYGTFEVRMKAAAGPGLNSSMFTYIGPVHKQPWDEIDFEILGKDTSKVQLNQYVSGKGGNEKLVPVPGGADKGFNDYAFTWEKNRLRYFINGKLVQTVTDPAKIPSHASKIYLALWGSDTLKSWLGIFADRGPVAAEIDRVAYTAPGAPCQFPESVACAKQ